MFLSFVYGAHPNPIMHWISDHQIKNMLNRTCTRKWLLCVGKWEWDMFGLSSCWEEAIESLNKAHLWEDRLRKRYYQYLWRQSFYASGAKESECLGKAEVKDNCRLNLRLSSYCLLSYGCLLNEYCCWSAIYFSTTIYYRCRWAMHTVERLSTAYHTLTTLTQYL